MLTNYKNLFPGIIVILFFLGGLITTFAQQQFLPDPLWIPPTQGNIGAPITNTPNTTQVKAGGIYINEAHPSGTGLIIYAEPQNNKGRLMLVPYGSSLTTAQEEQISLVGNLDISGLLKPNGVAGLKNQILVRGNDTNGHDAMTWGDTSAWITVTGGYVNDLTCLGALPPARCEEYNPAYTEYQYHCLSQITGDPTLKEGYSAFARICRKTF